MHLWLVNVFRFVACQLTNNEDLLLLSLMVMHTGRRGTLFWAPSTRGYDTAHLDRTLWRTGNYQQCTNCHTGCEWTLGICGFMVKVLGGGRMVMTHLGPLTTSGLPPYHPTCGTPTSHASIDRGRRRQRTWPLGDTVSHLICVGPRPNPLSVVHHFIHTS